MVEPFCIMSQDKIILSPDPAFLPKVASNFHQLKEIIILSFCGDPKNKEAGVNKIDVRRCMIPYIEHPKEWISTSLFLLFTGPNKGKKA